MKNRDKYRCNLRPTFLQLSLQLYRTSIQPSVTKEKNFLKRATFNPFSAQRVEIHLTLFSMLRKPFNFYQRSSNATHHIHPLKGSHQKNHPFFRTLSLSWTVFDIRGATCISDVVFSCPQQLNRWPCHWLTNWLGEWPFDFDIQRATLETCDLWDIWSEWWGDMT